MLEERIRQLEEQLASQHIGDEITGGVSNEMFDGTFTVDGSDEASSAAALFDSSRQGYTALTSYSGVPVMTQTPLSNSLATLDWPYPPLDLTLHLAETFFTCCPFVAAHLHKKTFFERILLPWSHSDAPHPSLVYAICAAASRHSPRVTSPPASESGSNLLQGGGDTFFDMAVSMTSRFLEEDAISDSKLSHKAKSLSAVLVLVHLMHSENKWADFHRYNALGMRGMIALKYHVEVSLTKSRSQLLPLKNSFDREQRKRILYTFWVFDVIYANKSGSYPSNLSSHQILLKLPTPTDRFIHATSDDYIPDDEPYLNAPNLLENHDSDDGFHWVIKATALLDKVNEFRHQSILDVISNPSLKSANQLPSFSVLDMAIMRFRSRLPDCWKNLNEGKLNVDVYLAHMLSLNALITLHNGYMREQHSKKRLMGCVRAALSTAYSLLNSSFDLARLPSYAIAMYSDSAEILIAAFVSSCDEVAKEAIKLELATFGDLFRCMQDRCPNALFALSRLNESLYNNGIQPFPPTHPTEIDPILQEISNFDVAAPVPLEIDQIGVDGDVGTSTGMNSDILPEPSFTVSDEYGLMNFDDVFDDRAFDVALP
ncbi:hypothetical protein E3P94_03940 [Wallemia ichthyophaga]|nr:hypothetical protein E3P95_03945 [Wallemia ichthyophaga]TIA95767.1 hypothetical protein E3P94_03940 [Wallemia ichthyophaga]